MGKKFSIENIPYSMQTPEELNSIFMGNNLESRISYGVFIEKEKKGYDITFYRRWDKFKKVYCVKTNEEVLSLVDHLGEREGFDGDGCIIISNPSEKHLVEMINEYLEAIATKVNPQKLN